MILTAENLLYRRSGRTLLQVDRLEADGGKFMALLGPNGAGKSTLLRCLAGELKTGGVIRLHDKDLRHWADRNRARHLGVLPQSSHLAFTFTAAEVVALGLIPLSIARSWRANLIRESMAAAGCGHLAERPWPALSGGERQRVQLARVLLQLSQAEHAPLLLLDEPTSAQDLGHQHEILQLARALCHDRGFAVIAVLHDLNQALRYCDRCWLLDHGELVGVGPPHRVLTAETVQRHWGYRPTALAHDDGQVVLF